jgi:hypothetical protein
MAFDLTNFSPLGGNSRRGKAPQLFSYATLDAHTDVDAAGYFNGAVAYGGAYHLLERGDIIYVVVWATAIGTGGTVSTYGPHVVIDKADGTVDVTNVTTGTVTDSD